MANLLDQTSSSVTLRVDNLVLNSPTSLARPVVNQRWVRLAATIQKLAQRLTRDTATRDANASQSPIPSCFEASGFGNPSSFTEFDRLARDSHQSIHQASEEQLWATRLLQVAASVANCNTYNRNQPVGELRKGVFFRGRGHEAGIDSRKESFRTSFQTIHDLIGTHASKVRRMITNRPSDYPRHAPSVQC